MNNKLLIDNLAATTTHQELMDLFSAYGNVAEINLRMDRLSGRPRGSGFVTMATSEGARSAILALHGMEIGNHTLSVRAAESPRERPAESTASRQPRRTSRLLF
jgi:RNA recognition motif-containing protein